MEFCLSCKSLNVCLTSFLSCAGTNDATLLHDNPIRRLGRLNEIRNRYKTCLLCRLLYAVFRSGMIPTTAKIAALDSIGVFAKWYSPMGPDKASRLKSPSLCILVWAEGPGLQAGACKVTLRAVSTALPDQPYFGRIAKASLLDFGEIKGWLRHCETKHGACNSRCQPAKPTEHFYVLDVQHRCIVKMMEACRYLALSYVWGGATQFLLTEDNLEKLNKTGSLSPELLGVTVQDALEVTRNIGERYLWVDTLCVIQDSKLVRQQTLQDMDKIYAQSLLTIIAGSCSTAHDHLPGVTQGRVWTPWYAKVSPALSISAHFDFEDLLEHTAYNQRAWTFQEYQLANRSLVFAPNGQIYFSCQEAVYAEDVLPGASLEPDVAMLQKAAPVRLQPKLNDSWRTYRRAVELYSLRSLTHQGDALDAFIGMLNKLSESRSLEGLPVALFDRALLWQPRNRLDLRNGFSSWSWVAWKGGVRWFVDSVLDVQDTKVNLRTWIVWYSCSRASSDCPELAMDGPSWLTGSPPTSNADDRLLGDQPRPYLPTATLFPTALTLFEASDQRQVSPLLQFWTFTLRAGISLDTHAVTRNWSERAENTGSGLRRFNVLNRQASCCGWVLLDEVWISMLTNGPATINLYEFILLSEVVHNHRRSDRKVFNAMMITSKHGITKRVGLGQLQHVLGQNNGLVWKEILLA